MPGCCKGGSGVCGFTCIHSALQTVCPSGLEGHVEVEGSETRILPQSFHTKLTFTRHPHSPASGYFCKILLDRRVSGGSRAAVKEDRAFVVSRASIRAIQQCARVVSRADVEAEGSETTFLP